MTLYRISVSITIRLGNSFLSQFFHAAFGIFILGILPVSYTHLDVYKRQSQWRLTCFGRQEFSDFRKFQRQAGFVDHIRHSVFVANFPK